MRHSQIANNYLIFNSIRVYGTNRLILGNLTSILNSRYYSQHHSLYILVWLIYHVLMYNNQCLILSSFIGPRFCYRSVNVAHSSLTCTNSVMNLLVNCLLCEQFRLTDSFAYDNCRRVFDQTTYITQFLFEIMLTSVTIVATTFYFYMMFLL